jgi:hypothetical protein
MYTDFVICSNNVKIHSTYVRKDHRHLDGFSRNTYIIHGWVLFELVNCTTPQTRRNLSYFTISITSNIIMFTITRYYNSIVQSRLALWHVHLDILMIASNRHLFRVYNLQKAAEIIQRCRQISNNKFSCGLNKTSRNILQWLSEMFVNNMWAFTNSLQPVTESIHSWDAT